MEPRKIRIKWAVGGLCALVIVSAGLPIAGGNRYETLYQTEPPLKFCFEQSCTYHYRVSIGNNGTKAQEMVALILDTESLGELILPISASNFGKVRRKIKMELDGDTTTVMLGEITSGKRVDVTFSNRLPREKPPVEWSTILKEVRPTHGLAKSGSMEAVTFVRFIHGLVGLF